MAFLWFKQPERDRKVVTNIVLVGLVGALATIILLSIISFSNYVDSKSGPQTEPLLLFLDSFSVSNLKLSPSSFSAKWDANLTFKNRNGGLKIVLYDFNVFVFRREGEPLACAPVEETRIDPKSEENVMVRLDTRKSCGFERPFKKDEIVKGLNEDVKSGRLSFSLRMKIYAYYRLRLLGIGTSVVLTPYCPDLRVEFVEGIGGGNIVGGRNCSIPLPK
ncbi:hypothetical protein UlMin_005415 [Ulmus minor]